jgi:hypothetical protein
MVKDIRVPSGGFNDKSTYVAGVDIARTGKDETAIVVLEQLPFDNNIFICYIETLHTPDLNMAINRMIFLNQIFNFKKIICDETGLGAGVTDVLKQKLGVKVEGIWYTNKSKNEIFNNLKILMTKKTARLYIPDYNTSTNPIIRKMFYQFLSINQEASETGNIKIYHEERSHDDIINALALAASYFNIKKSVRSYPFLGIN